MGSPRHSRESIVQTLQNIAQRSGRTTLSKRDVQPHLPLSAINYHFGNLSTALKAAGLEVAVAGSGGQSSPFRIDDGSLFASLLEIEQKIGHPPNLSQYRANGGRYSNRPFSKRFGDWTSVLQHFNKWKAEHFQPNGVSFASGEVPHNGSRTQECVAESRATTSLMIRVAKPPHQLYGEPIDFRGLRHAPINEQGVVYLFGMVSRELGFSVEALQQGFPDCEGKYLHDKSRKLWAKAALNSSLEPRISANIAMTKTPVA